MENKLIEQFKKLVSEMFSTANLLDEIHPESENAAELRKAALEYSTWKDELIAASSIKQ